MLSSSYKLSLNLTFRHIPFFQFSSANDYAKLSHIYYESPNKSADINFIVLHGLFGSAQNFRTIVKNNKISDYANSYLLDLRNHGGSEHKDSMSMEEMAADVYNFIEENNLQDKKIVIMGHSMGAKVTMAFASMFPDIPHGVIVVDYVPYNYLKDPKFQVVRTTGEMINKLAQLDLKNSEYNKIKEDISKIAFSKDVAGLLLTNIMQNEDGNGYRWKPNLAGIAKNYEKTQGSDWSLTQKYLGPVRVICGADSEYVSRELMKEYHKVFTRFKEDEVIFVEGAGHWVHFQKPYEFIDKVSEFLKEM